MFRGAGHGSMSIVVAIVTVACSCGLGSAGGHEGGGNHADTELTSATFDAFLEKRQSSKRACLVMFHVSWCKVCQRTYPKFAAASDLVAARSDITMDFAHVDCTDDKSLCQRYNVKGYPTIKFFEPTKDAEPLNYKGQRVEHNFLKYAERMTQPPVREFANKASFGQAFDNETLASFIAVKSGREAAGLVAAATKWRDRHIFAVAPSLQDLLPDGAAPPAAAVLAVLSSGAQQWRGADNTSEAKPAIVYFDGSLEDVEAVTKWVDQNRFPGIWALDETNFFDFTHAARTAAMIALNTAVPSLASVEQTIRSTEEALRSKFLFGILDGVGWADELLDFGISKDSLPRIFVAEDDFEYWVEDIDELRVETMEADLAKLAAGAPLLRQGRSTWARMMFYRRETSRYSVQVQAFASQGAWQAAVVVLAFLAVLALIIGLFKGLGACCRFLLAEDEFDGHPGGYQAGPVPGHTKRE